MQELRKCTLCRILGKGRGQLKIDSKQLKTVKNKDFKNVDYVIKRLMHTLTPFKHRSIVKNFVDKVITNRIQKSLIILERTDNILNIENTKLSLKSHTMPPLPGRNGVGEGKYRRN